MVAAHHAIDEALARFQANRERFDRAGQAVINVLEETFAPSGITARLSHRVKDIESYRAKVLLKQYEDPWADVTDKVGVRALVERAGDVDQLREAIEASPHLTVRAITDKRTELAPREVGYSGLHLDLIAPAEDEDQEPVLCELQIRTVAQDAWSVVSHRLLYKGDVELPEADKRAVWRLAALVELFDEEVQRVMDKHHAPIAVAAEHRDLVEVAAAQYARFAHNDWSRPLARRVIRVVEEQVLSDEERPNYPAMLQSFVDEQESTLRQLYRDYGPGSPGAITSAYVLWSQPESLVLLERLEMSPQRLVAAWHDAGLPGAWLEPLATASSADVTI